MWTYTILRQDQQGWFASAMTQPVQDLEEAMNALGGEGWELVAFTEPSGSTSRGPGGTTVVMSRGAEFYFKKHY